MKENERIEFKKSTSEINEAMNSISAILNKHRSGIIYFGLKNDGTPFKFQINESTIRDVSRKIFEVIKPQIFPIIEVINIEGIEVIKVEFFGDDIPYSSFGKYYIRTADEDRELTPQALRKIMINKEYEENWEEKISVETIDDIDELTLEKFRKKASNCGRLIDLEYSNVELLKKLNLIANGKLNNAGRLLFSKNNPIVLKMAVFATNEKKTFLDLTRVEGNIFQLIDKAMKYLVENLRWRVEMSDDNIHRNEIPEIPIEALREIVVNSFTHARYDIQIQHEIDIFSDRVVVSNPGSFANDYDPEDFAMSNMNSFLRNEKIAKVLYLCKDVESFGTGFNKIYSLCKKANVKLGYNKYDEYFNFIFYREDRNVVTNVVTNVVLNDNEKHILELLRNDNFLTASKISEMINQSSRNIQRIMDSLRNKGLIERIGSNKSGYWNVK